MIDSSTQDPVMLLCCDGPFNGDRIPIPARLATIGSRIKAGLKGHYELVMWPDQEEIVGHWREND